MKTQSSALRKASARIEALEVRSMFSGEIDHGFGDRGQVETTFPAEYADHNTALLAKAVTVQADGKLIIVSQSSSTPDTAIVARYSAYGAVDKTFGTNGFATIGGVKAGVIDSVTVLASGKIQVGGQVYFRLTSAGKLDGTYGGGDGIAWSAIAGDKRAAQADVIQSDGSVLELQAHAAGGKNVVTKYRVDGSIDTTFAIQGVFSLAPYAVTDTGGITTDAKGRVYVSYLSGGKLKVLRLTAAGQVGYVMERQRHRHGRCRQQSRWRLGRSQRRRRAGDLRYSADVQVHHRHRRFRRQRRERRFETAVVSLERGQPELRRAIDSAGQGRVRLLRRNAHVPGRRHVFQAADVVGHDAREKRPVAGHHLFSGRRRAGGFAAYRQNTAYVGSAITSAGSAYVIGKGTYGNSYGVRLTPLGTANHLSVQKGANNTVTINNTGTNADIEFWAQRYTSFNDPKADWAIFLDDDIATSVDMLYYKTGQALPKITANLGGQSDRFIATGWTMPVTVNGGAGNDYLVGGDGNDSLSGGDGNDLIEANAGNDTIHGDAGNDSLVPLAGNNVVYGDAGRDTIH